LQYIEDLMKIIQSPLEQQPVLVIKRSE